MIKNWINLWQQRTFNTKKDMSSGLTIPLKPHTPHTPHASAAQTKDSTPNSARMILKPSTFDGKEATPRNTMRSKVTFNDVKLPTVPDADDIENNFGEGQQEKTRRGSHERTPSQISLDHKSSVAISVQGTSRRSSNGIQLGELKVPMGVKIIDTNNNPMDYVGDVNFKKTISVMPKTTTGLEFQRIKNKLSLTIPAELNPRSSRFKSVYEISSGAFTERASAGYLDSMPSAITPQKSARGTASGSRLMTSGSDFLYSALPVINQWKPLPGEESVYQKNPALIEQGEKMFKKKVSTLDNALIRKSKYDSLTYRKEFLKSDSNFMKHANLLNAQQYNRMTNLKVEDDKFFNKVTQIFTEGALEFENGNHVIEDDEDLSEDNFNTIKVEKFKFIYSRIQVKGKSSPLTITISCPKQIKKVKTLVSTQTLKPTKSTCEYEFDSRSFKLAEKERLCSRFTNNYFYFGFFADEAGTISVKVEFPSEESQKNILKRNMSYKSIKPKTFTKKMSNIDLPSTNAEMEEFKREVQEIRKEKRQKMLLLSDGVDKVKENKHQLDQFLPENTNYRREMSRQKSEEQIRLVQFRKNEIEFEKLVHKKAQVVKHDVQKMAKNYVLEEQYKEYVMRMKVITWFTNVFMCNMGQGVIKMLKRQKAIIAKQFRLKILVKRFIRRIRNGINKRGPVLWKRFCFDIKSALQFHCHTILLHKRHEVENVIVNVLQDMMATRILMNKLSYCIKAVCKVQTLWRSYTQRKEAFKTCLLMLWDKYYLRVYEDMGQNKTTDTPREKQNHSPLLITALQKQGTLKKLKSSGNTQAIEMKEDPVAKTKFMNMWFGICVRKYRKNYEVHHKELGTLTDIERKQLLIQTVFRTNEEKEKDSPKLKKMVRASRQSILAEFEKNRLIKTDYSLPEVTHEEKLLAPRLFLVPTPTELQDMLREIINIQKTNQGSLFMLSGEGFFKK